MVITKFLATSLSLAAPELFFFFQVNRAEMEENGWISPLLGIKFKMYAKYIENTRLSIGLNTKERKKFLRLHLFTYNLSSVFHLFSSQQTTAVRISGCWDIYNVLHAPCSSIYPSRSNSLPSLYQSSRLKFLPTFGSLLFLNTAE